MKARGLPLVMTLLLATSRAEADPPPDPSSREAVLFLYNQGKELFDAGKVREACAKFEDGKALDPTAINLLMRLGDCYEKLGRTASAHAIYLDAVREAGDRRDAREAAASARARAIESLVPALVLVLPKDADRPGLVVLVDGRPIARADLGAARAVDPGDYRVDLRAPGAVPRTLAVKIAGPGARVVVTLPRLDDVPPPPVSSATMARRRFGISLGALGLVGLGVGAGLGARALADNAASNRGHCDRESLCDDEGFALRTRARRFGDGATIAILAGGAALAGGATLIFTALPARGGAAAFASMTPGEATLGLRGSF